MLQIPQMPQLWTMEEVKFTKCNLLGSLAKWAVRQSPYPVPDYLREALEQFAELWDWGDYEPIDSSPLRERLIDIFEQCPLIMSWNEPKKGGGGKFVFCSRYDQPHPDFDIIDIHALARNVAHDLILEGQVYNAQDNQREDVEP